MTQSPQLRPAKRAPRVNLRGTISATIQLENGRQFLVKVQQLSITGGLLELGAYLDERTGFRVTLPAGPGTVHPKAEMLFPMLGPTGYLQPFRFTGLRADERQMLEREITDLLKQTTAGHGLGLRPPQFFLESF